MAIEGPLRELGIHDVFQLLDLSRKTGMLRVTSTQRDDEGQVGFDHGRVVLANIRSKAAPVELALLQAGRVTEADLERARLDHRGRRGVSIADILVEIGATTQKELERHLRQQIEGVVFELMSWSEGYFSFEEQPRDAFPSGSRISVSTESLLMEGARRIDEWSRIAATIPDINVIPDLAPIAGDDHGEGGSHLDLLPHEWQVLTMIDGTRDLRSIAGALARDEFEIAKIAYGLVRTGVIAVRVQRRRSSGAYRRSSAEVDGLMVTARDHTRAGRHGAALGELRRAVRQNSATPAVHRALGFAAMRVGDLALARSSWDQYLRLADGEPESQSVRDAVALLTALTAIVENDVLH